MFISVKYASYIIFVIYSRFVYGGNRITLRKNIILTQVN